MLKGKDMIDIQIKNIKSCMECHACYSICPVNCIMLKADVEGFLYPTVNYDSCIKCNRCVDVCPIINKTMVDNDIVAYACINKNEDTRLDSSSGGLFTLVAEKVLSVGGVVFGAMFNENFELEHRFVESKEALYKLRGAKYVQSKIGDTYKQANVFLKSGMKVLFSGTPCQISGLKSYLGKHYENLITIDIICHGVPSPDVWKKYVAFRIAEAKSPVQQIYFRKKNKGWKQYSISFLFKNNTEYQQNFREDLYMKAFLKDVCLRPSCYECKFKGINRQSDITLGDFWGIKNLLPEMDDDKGTSLIFVNSQKGLNIFDEIKERMFFEEVDLEEAIKYNSAAIKSSRYNPNRAMFMVDKDNLSFDNLVKKYCSDKLTIRLKRKIKSVINKLCN